MALLSMELLQESVRLRQARIPHCTVMIVDARGSIPQEVGAKALIGRDGLLCGTIGGGKVEQWGCNRVNGLLADSSSGRVVLERINLNRDLGMTCAGEMTLLYEIFQPEFDWNIFVFGAGHIAQKLCRLLIELDCRVTCIDTRLEWIDRLPQHAKLERLHLGDFVEGVRLIPRGADVVVMTMGHATDLPILVEISRLGTEASFIGALGSDSKAATMRRELAGAGVPREFIDRINCPIGEKFGDNTPPEIAVSVLAQLVRLRH